MLVTADLKSKYSYGVSSRCFSTIRSTCNFDVYATDELNRARVFCKDLGGGKLKQRLWREHQGSLARAIQNGCFAPYLLFSKLRANLTGMITNILERVVE